MLAVLTSLKCCAKCWGWNPIDVVPIETKRFKGWQLIYPNEPCHAVDFSYPACSIAPKCNTLRNVSGWSAPNLALAICVPTPLHLLFLLEGSGVAINFRFQHFGHEKAPAGTPLWFHHVHEMILTKKRFSLVSTKNTAKNMFPNWRLRKKKQKKIPAFCSPPQKKNMEIQKGICRFPSRILPTKKSHRWAWNLPLPAVSRVQLRDIAPWPESDEKNRLEKTQRTLTWPGKTPKKRIPMGVT